jgi:hypothetical protein
LITGKAALKRADLLEAIADSLEVFDGRETFLSPVLCLGKNEGPRQPNW